jgi:large subunit ribosomal protein L29
MTPEEIRKLTDEELGDKLEEAKEELFNLRFQKASGQLENTARMQIVRRDIARLRTIQHERKLAAQVVKEGRHAK